ncbi:MAG: asparagine synthase-related protein, partial [Planctomycetia bacterium]
YKVMLPGLLMNHKGDRPGMANSVETRYPFLDEEVVQYCASLNPRWKLRGATMDKHLLRRTAAEMLPKEIAYRRKAMFRAPFAQTFFDRSPAFIDQLLSRESLEKSGYFNADAVEGSRRNYHAMPAWSMNRMSHDFGLTMVASTQLWHHLYMGGGLCELPAWSPPATAGRDRPARVETMAA